MKMTESRILVGATVLALFLATATAFQCPVDCSCMEIPRNGHVLNHAKCSSLDGLRQLGKTSELHSVDVSGIGLTKITNQLDKLNNLTQIDLQDNRLSEVNNLSGKRVHSLNLSNNQITSGKLSKIPTHVRHLNLTRNSITYLPLEFKRLVHLKTLELSDNPLNCTCETLEVRNWLQENKVWTDSPILCMAPIEIKGRPWLQIRQSDVCDANGLDEPRTLPFAASDDENDLMQGDDPNVLLADHSVERVAENDELKTDFLPVVDRRAVRQTDSQQDDEMVDISEEEPEEGSGESLADETSTKTPADSPSLAAETYEGSGDDSHTSMPLILKYDDETVTTTEASEAGERSFGLVTVEQGTDQPAAEEQEPIVEASTESALENTTTEVPLATEPVPVVLETEYQTTEEEQPIVEPDVSAAVRLLEEAQPTTEPPQEVQEEHIVAVESPTVDAEVLHPHEEDASVNQSSSAPVRSDNTTAEASSTNSSATYILLILIGVLIVVLILYVANKRRRTSAKNRRNNNDIENQAQEMLNMDKNNLGKPITNGTEFIPLMPNKHPVDKENNLCNAQEPLLKKLTEEDETSQRADEPTQDAKQQNGSVVEAEKAKPAESIPANGEDAPDGKPYQPISPKPSRYSPVSLNFAASIVHPSRAYLRKHFSISATFLHSPFHASTKSLHRSI